jgi:hypothetical protein
MTLRPPEGQSFDVIVPLIGRDAVIALAEGTILPPGRQVDMGVGRAAGEIVLTGDREIEILSIE